jgi:hypothetical protein
VTIVDSQGRAIPTAQLTHGTATITPTYPNRNSVFTTMANSDLIGTNFVASAPGFAPGGFPVTAALLDSPQVDGFVQVTVTLDGYADVNVTVNVYRFVAGGPNVPLTTAMLTFDGTTQGPNSTFALVLDGSNVGDGITAVAPGFAAYHTHNRFRRPAGSGGNKHRSGRQ